MFKILCLIFHPKQKKESKMDYELGEIIDMDEELGEIIEMDDEIIIDMDAPIECDLSAEDMKVILEILNRYSNECKEPYITYWFDGENGKYIATIELKGGKTVSSEYHFTMWDALWEVMGLSGLI
jgi:hypothetical protein